jgi:hypothetical protein
MVVKEILMQFGLGWPWQYVLLPLSLALIVLAGVLAVKLPPAPRQRIVRTREQPAETGVR